MVDTLTPVLTANWSAERSWTLESYEQHGGYRALKKALTMAPDDI
ncbi:MAG: NADH-quinone oxidoreductase subunit F, partial [Nocardioides sp.]